MSYLDKVKALEGVREVEMLNYNGVHIYRGLVARYGTTLYFGAEVTSDSEVRALNTKLDHDCKARSLKHG